MKCRDDLEPLPVELLLIVPFDPLARDVKPLESVVRELELPITLDHRQVHSLVVPAESLPLPQLGTK